MTCYGWFSHSGYHNHFLVKCRWKSGVVRLYGFSWLAALYCLQKWSIALLFCFLHLWVYYASRYCKWENLLRTSEFALGKLVELPLKYLSGRHLGSIVFILTLEIVNGDSGIHSLSCFIFFLGKVFGIWISKVLNWYTKQLEWRHR